MSGRYADFRQVTEDALIFVARTLALDLDAAKRDALMEAYLRIEAWPDVLPALSALKDNGIRLGLLSNFTDRMLQAAVANSRMAGLFDHLLSTDRVRAYKPDPHAYRIALDAFGLQAAQIAFVAFGGWDAAGAKAFGHPTFWVNRARAPPEELSDVPDATGTDLRDLIAFVAARG